ncbi:PglL family O-oligosaccharyltransferase [Hafnia alvei]|uniref:Lipid A core - O-antigen ligase and related enzymes n=1 Tax=Hafnia alvei TaxID=569 RepID=A0ABD7QAF8_HAFAL|nr:O-antigen ligase family protein [Hafnia alvei]TBL69138.1 hypothetical protein EYY96_05360 [Hafnia alvei]
MVKVFDGSPMVSYQRRKWMSILILLYMCLIHYQWPTLSGGGLELTLNMIVWLAVSLLIIGLAMGLYRRRWQCGIAPTLALLGGGLLTLPILWSGAPAEQILTLQRLAGIWGAIFLFFLLVQWPVTQAVKVVLATLITWSAIIETLLAVVQIMFPNWAGVWLNYSFLAAEGRPLGALLQVNLLGSFLSTGFACALWLFFFQSPLNSIRKRSLWLIIILGCGVTVTQSRTAWVGMFLSAAVIILCAIKRQRWRTTSKSILCIIAGVVLGVCALAARVDNLEAVTATAASSSSATIPKETQARLSYNRQHSGIERQSMTTGTLAMIALHPWKGWGLGCFERKFPEVLAQFSLSNPFTRKVIYPHNELLYVWAEGGIVAALGLIILGILWSLPILAKSSRKLVAFWAISIPLVVHMMTEYPFYQSALHLLTLVLLIASSIPRSCFSGRTVPFGYQRFSVWSCYVAACIGGVFMATGLISAMHLWSIERSGLQDTPEVVFPANPWAQPDHFLFDRAVSRLMNFNKTYDTQQLQAFRKEAEAYLQYHNDANLVDTLLRIAHAEHRFGDVQIWNERGCLSFPQDPRFKCS